MGQCRRTEWCSCCGRCVTRSRRRTPQVSSTATSSLPRLAEAVTADGWNQEEAARWWELHQPAREEADPSLNRQATVKVTRALS